MALTIPESMIYTTVRISVYANGNLMGSGTGFFWECQVPNGKLLLLVTNKHVLAGADKAVINCHRTDVDNGQPNGQTVDIELDCYPDRLVPHPNPDVDLVAMNFSPMFNRARSWHAPLFLRALSAANVPTLDTWAQLDAIEEVVMVGYPNGLMDEVNKLPLVRRGITATQATKDYNGKPHFVVDMACFPGSSGSPVFLWENQILGSEDSPSFAYRFFFLGVLFSGPQITNEGAIINSAPPSNFRVATMMHLGNVVKSTEMSTLDGLARRLHSIG